MISSFKPLHEAAARVASSSYVTRSGLYDVTIAQAHVSKTPGGSTCVSLDLKTALGELAFIQLYVLGTDGKRTFSHDIFDALLVVLGVQEAPVVKGKVYDRFTNGFVDGYRIHAIEKKRLGVVLQKVTNFARPKSNGEPRVTIELLTPFDLTTRKIAKEILTGSEAARLDQIENAGVKDKTIYPKDEPAPVAQTTATAAPQGIDNMDEDIPF